MTEYHNLASDLPTLMTNSPSLKKLTVVASCLLAINLVLTYVISLVNARNSPYPPSDQEASSLLIWGLVFIVIIPLFSLTLAAIAAFFRNEGESYVAKLLKSFLTTLSAINLL